MARDAHFLLGLQKAGVEFVAVDMPHANRLTIGIMALVAEEEARATSARTKAALAAARSRGVKLGNPQLQAGSPEMARCAAAARSELAAKRAVEVQPYIERAKRAGASSLREVVQALTALGLRTPTGKRDWGKEQVRQALLRIAAADGTR